MKLVSVPLVWHQSRIAPAVSSGSLSVLMNTGAASRTATRFSSSRTTGSASLLRPPERQWCLAGVFIDDVQPLHDPAVGVVRRALPQFTRLISGDSNLRQTSRVFRGLSVVVRIDVRPRR